MHKYIVFLFLFGTLHFSFGQATLKRQISDTLNAIANRQVWVGNVTVRSLYVNPQNRTVTVTTNENLGYLPFREENVNEIYSAIRSLLSPACRQYKLTCKVGHNRIEQLIPNYYRNGQPDADRQFRHEKAVMPLVTNTSHPHRPTQGLQGKHIALWQSHGLHYDQNLARWEWQRARLFTTVEDLYTQSYVLPFLVPMLEHAGANVLLPRERDTQRHEVIVDNDTPGSTSRYQEHDNSATWSDGTEAGFAHPKSSYLFGENPFGMGTYRVCETVGNLHKTSQAEWIPDIPEAGRYAVYVSYKSLPNSTDKARYTVHHKGGKTSFEVNQRMYGGTWLYLGHFDFAQGTSDRGKVVLDNYGTEKSQVVTADAVKFGGGMGNMARSPLAMQAVRTWRDTTFRLLDTLQVVSAEGRSIPNERYALLNSAYRLGLDSFIPERIHRSMFAGRKAELFVKGKAAVDSMALLPAAYCRPETSGYPRFTEGARYWLQWAGAPDSVYSRTGGENDYLDDFQSRGFWVNYISGGSDVAPDDKGLNVPVDLSLGFHSDAGTTGNDSIIGTLVICTTRNSDKKYVYKNGTSRLAARDLADIVQTQIVSDLRLTYAPEWVRRSIWDKSYSESRVPEVPSMLLELLSHQNFADMRYGLDPRFRFTVCRAIYKGLLKYFESADGTSYTVQPLPVEGFNIRFVSDSEIELNWKPTTDPLEPTAQAKQYIVYMQMDDSGFDNGYLLDDNRCRFKLDPDHLYSFKVTAVNEGGESFPSETLSAGRSSQGKGNVLVVNGFDRTSAPASFAVDSTYAGFITTDDAGVPYLSDIAFVGDQYEFRRDIPWADDDAPGFGASHGSYETVVVAGNTFDYPATHGRAILKAGHSFVSSSRKAVTDGLINLNDYPVVDLILGKQRETFIGNRLSAPDFKTFPLALQEKITEYCRQGGHFLVSGANIASDLYHNTDTTGYDIAFANQVLKYKLVNAHGSQTGTVKVTQSPCTAFTASRFNLYSKPNSDSYYVESPDAIAPAEPNGHTICRYADNNLSAGIVHDAGTYKICALGFPFETIKEENERNKLMESVLNFFGQPSVRKEPTNNR